MLQEAPMKLQAISGGKAERPMALHALVIDADSDEATRIAGTLAESGFRPATATCAADGLRALVCGLPDVVVLDVEQPDVSGWELLRRVRRTTDAPVLVVSARHSDVDVARGLALGADDYLAKPFSPLELEARAHALLRRAAPRMGVRPEPRAYAAV
jgi:DNA-binding response OmpR family regulator